LRIDGLQFGFPRHFRHDLVGELIHLVVGGIFKRVALGALHLMELIAAFQPRLRRGRGFHELRANRRRGVAGRTREYQQRDRRARKGVTDGGPVATVGSHG